MVFSDQEGIQLSFFSKPDGPLMGFGSYKPTVLVPGYVSDLLPSLIMSFL